MSGDSDCISAVTPNGFLACMLDLLQGDWRVYPASAQRVVRRVLCAVAGVRGCKSASVGLQMRQLLEAHAEKGWSGVSRRLRHAHCSNAARQVAGKLGVQAYVCCVHSSAVCCSFDGNLLLRRVSVTVLLVCTAIAKQCATDVSISSGVLHIRKQHWAGCDA